jgi:hypothetical protein
MPAGNQRQKALLLMETETTGTLSNIIIKAYPPDVSCSSAPLIF